MPRKIWQSVDSGVLQRSDSKKSIIIWKGMSKEGPCRLGLSGVALLFCTIAPVQRKAKFISRIQWLIRALSTHRPRRVRQLTAPEVGRTCTEVRSITAELTARVS